MTPNPYLQPHDGELTIMDYYLAIKHLLEEADRHDLRQLVSLMVFNLIEADVVYPQRPVEKLA
jgi:hypothetical protein